jgi:hypothetical protein
VDLDWRGSDNRVGHRFEAFDELPAEAELLRPQISTDSKNIPRKDGEIDVKSFQTDNLIEKRE